MPIWLYECSPLTAALTIAFFVEVLSLAGLLLARRFVLPRLHYSEGVNEAISGTVQAIGVFYGITVGLIAVGVWNTNTNAADLVSKEATRIASLYRDVSGYPEPLRGELRAGLHNYTVFIVERAWPAQREGRGQVLDNGAKIMDEFQSKLYTFDPKNWGQLALHTETLKAYNELLEVRRLRIDAVSNGLSLVMWWVIWAGAVISIGVAYFYNIKDQKLHAVLVALMGGFLSIVLFMVLVNDKPFHGQFGISSDPYRLILERVIDKVR